MARPLTAHGATLRIPKYDGNIVTFQFVLQVRQFKSVHDDSQSRMITSRRVACIAGLPWAYFGLIHKSFLGQLSLSVKFVS